MTPTLPPRRSEVSNGWYPPFFIGATLGAWWPAVLRWGGRFPPRRWLALAATCLATPACSAAALAQRVFYGSRLRACRLDPPPIIIAGLWRTGTTLLHELLAADPRHAAPSTYQSFAPAHFLVTERVLAPLFGLLVPESRPQDRMILGMERAQEDEIALAILGLPSIYLSLVFPQHERAIAAYCDRQEADPTGQARWKREFLAFLKAVALRRPGRLVLKSPPHASRVALLLEALPEARFIYTVRDPMDAVPSWLHTVREMTRAFGLQAMPESGNEDASINAFEDYARRFERDRQAIAPDRIVELRYERLVADPQGALGDIYRALNLGDFEPARSALAGRLAEMKTHRRSGYDPPPALRDRIERQFRWYREKYGYV